MRSVNSIQCLCKDVLPRSRSLQANRCSHLSSSSLACSCSASGYSFRPWRFNSSRIHSFLGPQVDPPKVSIRRTMSSTWLAGVTLPTIAFAGTSMGWALRFLRQIGTQEDLGCNSPYVAVGTTEVGNWGPHAGSASMWTCIQWPLTTVLPWMLMVPNGGMVIL